MNVSDILQYLLYFLEGLTQIMEDAAHFELQTLCLILSELSTMDQAQLTSFRLIPDGISYVPKYKLLSSDSLPYESDMVQKHQPAINPTQF